MKGRLTIGAGILALAALAGTWFYANFEKVPVKEWVGPSGEARTRHFLAAQRFAERLGWNAAELRAYPGAEALPAAGVLLIPNRRQALDGLRIGEILRWVERGGHLIVEAEFLGVADPLLDRLGVSRSSILPVDKPMRVHLPGGGALNVSITGGSALQITGRPIRLIAGTPEAARLATFARGRGVVTVATSLSFARNRGIGAHDHAELVWRLLSQTGGRELQVYFRPERLSLWGFLKANAAPALAAGGLLLALWVWSIGPRFGPVAPDRAPGRRRLLDHLRASGRYYWATGLRSRLVVAARDAALRRIARAQPDFAVAPAAERATRLASFIDSSREDAARFLSAAGAMRGADFIKLAQQAQRVHQALDKGKQ